jgi:hypothetical protein
MCVTSTVLMFSEVRSRSLINMVPTHQIPLPGMMPGDRSSGVVVRRGNWSFKHHLPANGSSEILGAGRVVDADIHHRTER